MDIQKITKLRQLTGAGMGDCKKALVEAGEDLDKAVEVLRKNGAVKAAKKADREAKEGLVAMAKADGKVAMVALNCETDFVARNDDFIAAVQDLADKLLTTETAEFKTWADEKIKTELVVKIGENIQLGDFTVIEGGVIGTYLHANKRVVASVVLRSGTEELAAELAMQVVAMSPSFIRPEDVPTELLDKEKEIITELLTKEGKPAEMIEKIMVGKVNKYYEEVCLTKQGFIKEDKQKVEDYVKGIGEDIKIVAFQKISI